MPNMSYCRFQNTLRDLRDCAESINDREPVSEDESAARTRLIELCADILASIGIEIDTHEVEKAIKEMKEDCQ